MKKKKWKKEKEAIKEAKKDIIEINKNKKIFPWEHLYTKKQIWLNKQLFNNEEE